MGAEEFSQKYFSRERVRNRMLKRAAEIWGFPESEMDDFDPLVTLLMEACSVEFEKISGEIGKTQNRMLERLAQLLYPGMIAVRPAYGIMQVRPTEPCSFIYPDAQFVFKPSANDRKRSDGNQEFYFSPSHAFKIADGSIKYIASGRELFEVTEGVQKLPVASSVKKNIAYQHSLWLGLELNEQVDSLSGMSFFFNWVNQPDKEVWYQYLPYTNWFAQSSPLSHAPGFPIQDVVEPVSRLEMEFDAMQKIEQEIQELYSRQFITISSKETLDQLKVTRKLYPPAFDQLFEKKELQELKRTLVWIEVRFPTVIPDEALDSVLCSINCLPVLNRKLNKFSYKLLQSINIIPLETEGTFLSVKEITNSLGYAAKLIPFANPASMQPETYTLRYGVNRFDNRDAYETLTNLLELIKEESSFFSSLGSDFLVHNIRELNQILARLEDKVKAQNNHQSPHPYLIIKPLKEGATVMVEYWSCNGEAANKVPVGSGLQAYRNNNVQSNSLYFITSTSGGRDKFTDIEKIDQYKKSLLTRNRIVTLEDLKAAVRAELGNSVKLIELKKTFIKGTRPGEGFIRCMQIIITPDQNSFSTGEWEQRLLELTLRLEKQSINNIPYQAMLAR